MNSSRMSAPDDRQLCYSMEMAEEGREKGRDVLAPSPAGMAGSRKRGLWHSLTHSPTPPPPRQTETTLLTMQAHAPPS